MKKSWLGVVFLAVYPYAPFLDWILGAPVAPYLTNIFIFSILALGLNIVVGFAGLLHLGIAAFFAIGAYTLAILTVSIYPFQIGFFSALVIATFVSALAGLLLGAPTLKLRGDYLAIVTLGFGELIRVTFLNLFSITKGPQGLNPIPAPILPGPMVWLLSYLGISPDFLVDFRLWYYLDLFLLLLVIFFNRNLENSRLGRSWAAIREDELAAFCCGINVPRVKLVAFAIGAALAGLAGGLYAAKLTTTADPTAYDFNVSVMVLCCVVLGGMGSINGVVAGVFCLLGFDSLATPLLGKFFSEDSAGLLTSFNNWRWLIFGVALIVVTRFRPEGLFPSQRVKLEFH